jgi:hypothetical protein
VFNETPEVFGERAELALHSKEHLCILDRSFNAWQFFHLFFLTLFTEIRTVQPIQREAHACSSSLPGRVLAEGHDPYISGSDRRMNSPHRLALFAVLLLEGTAMSGCAPQPVVVGSPKEFQNLIFIGQAYIDAAEGKQGPPKHVDDLTPFLKPLGNPDEVLVSPNDGLPYAIVWGVKPGRYPIAYEQKGKEGKRIFVDARLMPWWVTDEQFARMRFPPDHKPPSVN